MSGTLPPEVGQRCVRRVERPVEVDVHHLLHLLGRHLIEFTVEAEPGVAHHHVQPSELRDGGVDEARHVGGLCHVGRNGEHPASGLANLGDHRIKAVRGAGADGDCRSVAREAQRRGAADAGRGSSDGDDGVHAHGQL